ncbi:MULTISPECIES: carbamoyltransferase C-terminal domain-containing protein [unclassified Microcoleus]|uniref:carbamoyltransferase C-terminal domain-containing protein n=1 Tax=unclassified Microcoleus TaxID=2642155 RepID=UPI002FD332A6
MKVLGIVSQTDRPKSHDGSAALIIDREIVCAIEQERLTRSRYAIGQGAADAAQACLEQAGLQLSEIDYIAYGWLPDLKSGTKLSNNIASSSELTPVILPPEQFNYTAPPTIHFVQHHHTHAAVTYYTSGFESAAVLVIDGRGEGESISLYHARGNAIELLESYPMRYSLGVFYSAAGAVAGLGGPGGHSGPGKLMGLAPFGQVRQEIDFSFDAHTGQFTLPAAIQKAVDVAPTPLLAGQMWHFWHDYYQQHFYPYNRQNKESSAAYDAMHYVDLAASVQHKLETICLDLAKRIKSLTGEQNLVLSGGCALNCSMNAYLSRQNIFDNIYVFPAANDAGCSIGAALALAHYLEPPVTTPPRLIAPALGCDYPDTAIATAIADYSLTPQKLLPGELAERVAADLANNKIVAWFRGKDELGPRALGRRSFMANPADREALGRLNQIKGREMWRPLAPSILEEQAETVLEGSMERGLHRYMLGVATVRSEWRAKVPAVVHIDFTTRPHFVQRDHDGLYWQVINRFYEKTGIPLVCNTSLNVAGQPLVHKPEEVLDIFTTRDDVQTLVIEGFYLTKTKG